MRKIFRRAFLLILISLTLSCNKSSQGGSVNVNFPDAGAGAVLPSASIDPNNQEQVVVIEARSDNQGGAIGQIADQDPSHTFCVIIDPAAGDDADLEVCEANRANSETTSVNGICPDAVAVTRCASRNMGSGPDFCQVMGTTDYIFVMMNLTGRPITVAYQVIDVTGTPNKSCTDLGITEDTIKADDF